MTQTHTPRTAPRPRPGILDIAPYVGGEAHAPGASGPAIRLASNEGALGPSPRAVEAYQRVAAELHRYPDGGAVALRSALARHYGIDAGRIVCGAGSDELIALLARAFLGPGDEVLYGAHGFLMYPIAARSAGATPIAVPERERTFDVDATLAAVTERTRLVFLANPNNPTGTCLSAEAVRRLHAGLPPDVLLVLDAAYAEYVERNDYSAGFELVEQAENVVVTRTFSKIHALGGLRLGWAYGPQAIMDVLNRVRGPFNVSAPALAAGVAALEDISFTDACREHTRVWRSRFTEAVRALGLTVHEGVANFVLVSFAGQGPGRDDAEAARQFLKARGILVRQMGGYGLPDCLRVTIGTGAEMEAVITALKEFLAR